MESLELFLMSIGTHCDGNLDIKSCCSNVHIWDGCCQYFGMGHDMVETRTESLKAFGYDLKVQENNQNKVEKRIENGHLLFFIFSL